METYKHISVYQAWELLQQKEQNAVLVDIRDLQSYQASHPQNAHHLQQSDVTRFCESLEFDQPLLVICYHGISSHGVAQYFANYGFEDVYTLDGGFAAWQGANLPIESEIA